MHEYNQLFAKNGLTCVVVPGTNVDGATRQELAGLTFLSGSVPGDVQWASYAGAPAVCTPAGVSARTGMPFGVQLGALPWQETEVLQVAIDYQAAYPYWSQAPPPLEVPRTLTTADVATSLTSAKTDPTGTVAKRPAMAVVPTLSVTP